MSEETVRDDLVPTVAEKQYAAASAIGVDLVNLGAPIDADPDRIVTTVNISAVALTLAAQPDVPRNITAALTDVNGSTAGVITFIGLDMCGLVVTEVMTIVAGVAASLTFVGTKLFASITSATVSALSGNAAGDAIIVGVGDVIALPNQIANAAQVKYVSLGGVPVTADAIPLTPNSGVDVNGATYNGTKVLQVAYHPGV